MKSIKHKLFLQIGLLMVLFIVSIILVNTFFLEKFYLIKTKSELLEAYEVINELDEEGYLTESLFQLSLSGSIYKDIVIEDLQRERYFTPMNPMFTRPQIKEQQIPQMPRKNPIPIKRIRQIKEEIIDGQSSFLWVHDEQANINYLSLESTLDNGYSVTIRAPLESVQKNVAFMNQFVFLLGLGILAIGMIVANSLSKHFTKPILNIFDVTSRIRRLEFDQQCKVMSGDELGRLAENINEMSDALKENINDLAYSNASLKEEVKERLRIDEQRKALLNNVSHELKTPLSLVQGYSEGLKLNLFKDEEKTNFYCDVIMDEAKKMDLLVSQLLEINHLQFGDLPLHKEEVLIKEFVEGIVRKYQVVFDEEKIDFSSDLALLKSEMVCHIDVLRTEQILTNLLNNAIAYVDERKVIQLKSKVLEKHVKLEVSNSCVPLPQEELDKLWQSFYKADKARTRENGGYGLGLSIIKAIQESDHNALGVEQQDGMITFWVEFDLLQE